MSARPAVAVYGYPYLGALAGNTPAAFKDALVPAHNWLARQNQPHPALTINAWNAWTEGSYREAIREIFSGRYKS
jgi:hypothetical protein